MVGTGRAAQLGILIKGPEVLEQTRQVTTIVLDKTGTLTEGRMDVSAVVPAAGLSEDELLRLAAGAEDASEHPIARAIAERGRQRLGSLPTPERFTSRAGLGVQAQVDGHDVLVGRSAYISEWASSCRRSSEPKPRAWRTPERPSWRSPSTAPRPG